MNELRNQFVNALLVILTVAASVAAFFNFQQNFHPEKRFRLPEDGVTWVDRAQKEQRGQVQALHVAADSPGDRAGIRTGDVVLKVQGTPIREAIDVARVLAAVGRYGDAEYTVIRKGVEFNIKLIVGERIPDSAVLYQYVTGLAWLGIGLFVYFRRGNSPKALHFLLLCLVCFVWCTFKFTGKLNGFDKVVYWGNVAAEIFAPTVFLHFCLTFPTARGWFRGGGRISLLYLPSTVLMAITVAIAAGNLKVGVSPIEVRWLLDRIMLGFFSAMYLLGALALHRQLRRTEEAIGRQQLRWLRNGALLGIVPYTAIYVIPYLLGVAPGPYMRWAVLFLPFIPLTWAYAIVRYKLMDVDVIFQQGYVYTLATIGVLAVFSSLLFTLGKVEDLSPTAVVALILVATFVFQPIRNWLQETLDRQYFYRDRYEARRTLVEFARELSSETDLDRMLESVADRLMRTLTIRRFAVLMRNEGEHRFRLWKVWPSTGDLDGEYLDLRYLPFEPKQPYLFFERTRNALDVISREWPTTVRHTIADLDLTYYLPCTVRGKTIAYLGVSRTEEGDFLSSDDLELLVTLSRYVGVAIENARLYSSLQQKVDEYERLKEFSENIVESINVGILAADLHDRVESWNSQIEKLTGVPREQAVGRCLGDLFPAELCERLSEVKGQTGIHNIYKFGWTPGAIALGASANGNGNGNGKHGGQGPRQEVIVNIAVAPLVSKDGDEIGRLIIFDDITDRADLEKRLLQADKLSSIGLLAAGVAHEVNTPLAVISTYAQMLTKQLSGDETKSKLLDKIARQTFRASEIVNSLLNFSRTSPSDFGEVDLNRVVEDTIGLVRHQLDKAHVRVLMDLQTQLPTVKGNAGKLQQVFLNLVLNARDAMESGGQLAIRSFSDGSTVKITVADTGQGIPAENLPRIYDPFFTTKVARKGTGLGLSVTYGIVQEHGGSIEVSSQLGQGTVFHLEFPLVRKPVAA